jgi:hypothetical protein
VNFERIHPGFIKFPGLAPNLGDGSWGNLDWLSETTG